MAKDGTAALVQFAFNLLLVVIKSIAQYLNRQFV